MGPDLRQTLCSGQVCHKQKHLRLSLINIICCVCVCVCVCVSVCVCVCACACACVCLCARVSSYPALVVHLCHYYLCVLSLVVIFSCSLNIDSCCIRNQTAAVPKLSSVHISVSSPVKRPPLLPCRRATPVVP